MIRLAMRLVKSHKKECIERWLERANYHDDLSKRLDDEGDGYSSDMAKIIADVFRLCAVELGKL